MTRRDDGLGCFRGVFWAGVVDVAIAVACFVALGFAFRGIFAP